MLFVRILAPAILLCITMQVPAVAQVAREADRVQQRVLQQEEERRRVKEERLRKDLKQPPAGLEPRGLEPVSPAPKGSTCIEVAAIDVDGVNVLSPKTIRKLTVPYISRCLGLSDINELLRSITNKYISKGYVTTRVYLPEQDVSTGVLQLKVIEGEIEDIQLNDGRGEQWQLKGPFMGLKSEKLNLRDLEQGLDQFNRLPSNNATIQLVPGGKTGQSVVALTNKPDKEWRASVGWEDSGQESTGRSKYSLGFEKDNLFGYSDLLALSFAATPLPWNSEEPPRRSRSFFGYWSIPLGYWTVALSGSTFTYASPIQGVAEVFSNEGNTAWQSFALDRVVHRDAKSKTTLGLGLEHRKVESFIEDVLLETGSYETTDLAFTANHVRRLLGGALRLSLGYHRGADFLWASDPLEGVDTPVFDYNRLNWAVVYHRPIPFGGHNLLWSTSLYAQYGLETLPSSERISIGSRYTVRGFSDDSLSGDSGGYVRNELSWRLPFPGIGQRAVRAYEFFAGYDAGMILKDETDPYERGHLQGVAVGFRTLGHIKAGLTLAKALAAPDFLNQEKYELYSSVVVAF